MTAIRLPSPGGDDNIWGNVLNEFLLVSHTSDGALQPAAVSAAGALTQDVANNLYEPIGAVQPPQVTLSVASPIAVPAVDNGRFSLTLTADSQLGIPQRPTGMRDGATWLLKVTASGADRNLTFATGPGGYQFGSAFTTIPAIVSGSTTVLGFMWDMTADAWWVTSFSPGF